MGSADSLRRARGQPDAAITVVPAPVPEVANVAVSVKPPCGSRILPSES